MELSEEGSTLYLGDYDYYLEKKAELEALAAAQAEAVPVSSTEEVTSNDYHLQKQNQKELRKITRRIEQLEAEMEELDQKSKTSPKPCIAPMMQLTWFNSRASWIN